jgi:hypothetical protein
MVKVRISVIVLCEGVIVTVVEIDAGSVSVTCAAVLVLVLTIVLVEVEKAAIEGSIFIARFDRNT